MAPHRIPWFLVAVDALSLITVGVVAGNLPHAAPPSLTGWSAAYVAGSSVYSEQVANAATGADRTDYWATTYGPEWSTNGAGPSTGARPWTDSYAPGSLTYAEQVPAADVPHASE